MRKQMIAGNWKMNKTQTEARALAEDLTVALKELDAAHLPQVVVCPPLVDLAVVREVLTVSESVARLGAQNVYFQESGAYTGETSPAMLKDAGCVYCLVGHSERRDYFHETDEDINKKVQALLAAGITPILCCGESLEVREAQTHVSFVVTQIKAALAGVTLESAEQLVIAYEPIWAIGTGKTATAADAQEVCGAIRATVAELYGEALAEDMTILYGGSANPDNIAGFMGESDVDGALVGGASLKADAFVSMIKSAATA